MRLQSNQTEKKFKQMGDRVLGVVKDVGSDAWDELKVGIDKAWEEIRMGVEEGLSTATNSFNKAWKELSASIDRAKDDLFHVNNSSGRSRKEKLS